MSWTVAASVFVVVFLAELPDKSMFAALVLGSRFRPLFVWLGVAAAFAVHVGIAVVAGRLIALAPQRYVDLLVAVLFAVGAVWVLRHESGTDPEPAGLDAVADRSTWWRVTGLAFGVVFVGEWGDITQVATANLAAASATPLSVAVGAVLALWAVSGLAVGVGGRLLQAVPMHLVQRVTAAILAALAVWSAVAAVRGWTAS